MRAFRASTAACLALLAAGCTDAASTTTSPAATTSSPARTMAPSHSATTVRPSPSPALITARPSTDAERERLAKEAEQVYMAATKELVRLQRQGGVKGPLPESLAKHLTGDALRLNQALLNGQKAQGVTVPPTADLSPRRIRTVVPGGNDSKSSTLIILSYCVERLGIQQTDPSIGRFYHDIAAFAYVRGALRISSLENGPSEACR